nr:MAG TPA: hypothetical protein [Caudoviricetes sp.]
MHCCKVKQYKSLYHLTTTRKPVICSKNNQTTLFY